DYPNERNTGCESTLDDSETAGICDDNIDDPSDADRFGDRLDLGCESFADQSEISGQCDDLLDNEGDGVRDYPADPDCTSYADDENEVCSGVDSDNDGFYNGPGCGTAIDCRDDDPNINPGATEICDCRDNNCDGNADETLPIVSGSLDAVVRMVQGTDVMGIQFTLHSCDDAVIYDEYARLVPPNWIDIINDNDPHRLIYAALDFNPANPMTIDAPFDTTIFSYDYVNTCRPTAASFPLSEEIITEWYLDYEDYPRERTVNGPGLFEVSVR
ncbi:MAG TPA: putative metal-binding motif-containing protein, partial [Candidatus Nanoarchaeia archaeon]|nr:putative metal-binding motif-containing protein [Candidatus Nanoarchaeia archaeon]